MGSSSLLVVVSKMGPGFDWQGLANILERHDIQASIYSGVNHEPEPVKSATLLCTYRSPPSDMQSMFVETIPVLTPVLGPGFDHTVYESLPTAPSAKGSGLAHTDQHILVMNAMTPTPTKETDFNDWYTYEHIPLLQSVPFWISSERYRLVSSQTNLTPRHLALHKWSDMGAFETDEYRAATNTSWRTEVLANVVEKQRRVLTYEGELHGEKLQTGGFDW